MNFFQVLLLILLIVLLFRWVYIRFVPGQRRMGEEPIVIENSDFSIETKREIQEAAEKVAAQPSEEKVLLPKKEKLKEKASAAAQVTYPIDFDYIPKPGESRFLKDPESGAHIWVWGGLPQGHLSYQGEMRNGLAHGEGEAIFRVRPTDHSPMRIYGQFRDGIFMGDDPFLNPVIALLPGDFLIQLTSPFEDGTEFFIQKGFLPDGLQLSLGSGGYSPDLLVIAPQGLSAIEEDTIRGLMKQAYDIYCRSCQLIRDAWVQIVPSDHVRSADNNRTSFSPKMASAQVLGVDNDKVQFYSYQNPEATLAEQRRKAEERQEAKRREQEMAPLRGRPDVRGVRLGMGVEEVWEVLQNEVKEWDGTRETPGEDRRYFRPLIKIRFHDGSRMKMEFCSRVSGSQLFLISYEQFYSEGIPFDEVIDKLEKKYGKPDDLHKLSSDTQYATYGLVSAIKPPDPAFGPGGAFFKTGVTRKPKTNLAEKLTIVFNDATLGYHDEAAIYEDQQDAARREFEKNKSDKVNF